MAGYDNNDLPDAMGALSVDDNRWKELGLNENIRTQLCKIQNDCESIFSWGIQRLTGDNRCLTLNLIDKIREKLEIITDIDDKVDEFNSTRFCLQLVACYELYMSKSYKEAYLEIERVVKFMETCTFDESNKQYSDAYNHIARTTNAYIALTLKIDSEQLLKDVKQINYLNEVEKAVVCAVKARIFMEYPVKGNEIALKFSRQACTLNSNEPEWIIIWLKAKGRVRRYYKQFEMPEDDEIDAAEKLCLLKSKPQYIIEASAIYREVGFIHKMKNNFKESNKFYNLSFDIAKKSVKLAIDDTKQLYSILMICCDYPKGFLPKSIIEDLVAKLSKVKNGAVDQVLGLYYLKHEQDYEKAKIYLSRGMAGGNFGSLLKLIKVECLLQPVNKFPYLQRLNEMYEDFPSPMRRLIILLHILVYYNYCEKNPKEMMRYLKLFIDQDIEDTFKKRKLMFFRPLFNVGGKLFKQNEFLNDLSLNVKELINYKWSVEEKQMIDYTFDRFNQILKLNVNFNVDNKTTVHRINESWRKQRVYLSENKSNESHQHQSASK